MAADSPLHTPLAASVRLTRCAVDHGGSSTSYARAGTGAPVVILDPDAIAGGTPSPLVVTLARRFRVIVPDATRDGDIAFSTWLRGFIDGLGQARVHVVAREAWALRALSFCITDPLRVGRLVLLFRDAADPALRADAAPDRLAGIDVRILVHRECAAPDGSSAVAGEPVLRFLLADDPVDTPVPRAE